MSRFSCHEIAKRFFVVSLQEITLLCRRVFYKISVIFVEGFDARKGFFVDGLNPAHVPF